MRRPVAAIAALLALAGCLRPEPVTLPAAVGDAPWVVELADAIGVETALITLDTDVSLFTFASSPRDALPRAGVFAHGAEHACPLPSPEAVFRLASDGTWVERPTREVGWYEDPTPTPTTFDLTSTCGVRPSPWALDATTCALRVRVDDPSWDGAELGLLAPSVSRRLRARDVTRRCQPIDATPPALGALECTQGAEACHVDLFDAAPPLVRTETGSLTTP